MGFIFFWAFVSKVEPWFNGISPTAGFLLHGTEGVFAPYFQSLAGNVFVDWLYMTGLLFVGLSLVLGIFLKYASYAGSLMMLLIYLSMFPPENNPLIDEHIIYIVMLVYLGMDNTP